MKKFLINALSATGQCHTAVDAEKIVENLIDSIKHIWPMIQKERAILYYEPCSNNISICKGVPFKTTISNLGNSDLKKLWYLYTKNTPALPSTTPVEIELLADSANSPHTGFAVREIMTSDFIWISFGGNGFNETPSYQVRFKGTKPFCVKNAHNKCTVQALLPFFQHSPKHPEQAYFDLQRKENVAAMPIRNEKDAGDLLRIGITIDEGKRIYSYHNKRAEFFCFMETGNNVYHGYAILEENVPSPLRSRLKK
jgi:hypothetical protein